MDDPRHTSIDVIAALHHPLRRRLVELLGLDGPATASRLAERTGELVGNISHHLKVLAGAGLVEEAPELAKDRRERWWRAGAARLSWSVEDVTGDPVGEVVLEAAERENLTHDVEKYRAWIEHRADYDEPWRRAAFSTDSWVAVTPAELDELGQRITAVIEDYLIDRRRDDGQEREHCFVFAYGMPARP
jgi:DNA-binding transcriptional ArsR family regulator